MAPPIEDEPAADVDRAAAVKPLSLVTRAHGHTLVQIERGERWAIYAQRRGAVVVAFEAILIRRRGKRRIAGKWLMPQECYPSDAQWGTHAWTFSLFGGQVSADEALAQARAKLRALVVGSGEQAEGGAPQEKLPTIGCTVRA